MSLHLYSRTYPRGAVVKLAASDVDTPEAKFVIERARGQVVIKSPGIDARGRRCMLTRAWHGTEAQAIEHCERECERIRQQLGGMDAYR